MISISEFARLGQVSVRMLRHYDQVELLKPERVDSLTGHRSYVAAQLDRLHSIVALKDLGFTLEEVRRVLDKGLSPDELQGMLRLRQSDLEREHALAQRRLDGVAHRLQLIEQESGMPKTEFVIKSLPAVRLAARTGVADLDSSIGPIVESLFDEAARAVNDAGGSLKVAVAHYEPTPGGTRVIAGYEYAGPPTDGVEIILLPSVDHAVCGVHLGNTAAVPSTWHHLMSHLESSGLSPAPFCRENYLEAEGENQSAWVIELQQPIVT